MRHSYMPRNATIQHYKVTFSYWCSWKNFHKVVLVNNVLYIVLLYTFIVYPQKEIIKSRMLSFDRITNYQRLS